METKFKLKEINGEMVLIKIIENKEIISICPFSQPIAVPGQLQGQIQLIPRFCGNNCALFNVYYDERIILHCSDTTHTLTQETNLIL